MSDKWIGDNLDKKLNELLKAGDSGVSDLADVMEVWENSRHIISKRGSLVTEEATLDLIVLP